ncbi:hypothetical protein VTN00DRAFT_7088 [Thermoascus crustaceus]|uniref:uncharacterized protein n=1 Tax=Thermoascus crustaceus TaxID=5088 RepID=UPI003743D845
MTGPPSRYVAGSEYQHPPCQAARAQLDPVCARIRTEAADVSIYPPAVGRIPRCTILQPYLLVASSSTW